MRPDTGEAPGPTPSQTVGPFFGFAIPFAGDTDSAGSAGEVLRIEGQLLDGAGDPVLDGLVEIFQGDQFARCRTDPEGAFHFNVQPPERREGTAPHFEVLVFARGLLRHLWTRLYLPGPTDLSDPVLNLVEPGLRSRLVARQVGGVLHFDLRLQGEGESVFFALPED